MRMRTSIETQGTTSSGSDQFVEWWLEEQAHHSVTSQNSKKIFKIIIIHPYWWKMIITSIFALHVVLSSNNDDVLCQYSDLVSCKHYSSRVFFFWFYMEINSSSSVFFSCYDDFPLFLAVSLSLSFAHSLIIVAFFAFSAYRIKKCKYTYRWGTLGEKKKEKKKKKEEIFFLLLICYSFIVSFSSVSLYFGMHSNKCVCQYNSSSSH